MSLLLGLGGGAVATLLSLSRWVSLWGSRVLPCVCLCVREGVVE